jgi:hypothetical protein
MMARQTIVVSDLSGKVLETGKAAKIKISFDDARKPLLEIDAASDEIDHLIANARSVPRRGRKPKRLRA